MAQRSKSDVSISANEVRHVDLPCSSFNLQFSTLFCFQSPVRLLSTICFDLAIHNDVSASPNNFKSPLRYQFLTDRSLYLRASRSFDHASARWRLGTLWLCSRPSLEPLHHTLYC
jgi:hypothetical protein